MCSKRYNGPKPDDMLPVGTKASIIVYAPDRVESDDYRVFEGEVTGHSTNNASWNYQHSSSPCIEAKNGRGGSSHLGTYGHKNSGIFQDSDAPFPKLIRKFLEFAGDDVYSLHINDWGTNHTIPGIQYICILTTLPADKGIEKLKEIVQEYKFYRSVKEIKKIKESYGE